MSTVDAPPYTPPPSIGHEIGVMFGFGGIMVVAMCVYMLLWRAGQKRSARKEQERCAALAAKGIYADEKTVVTARDMS
ncbi:hypothetical protein MMC18_001043 [Xylographa bjoerkii]|nr:hypothetical protein [Xylographa bjoerkii]